VATLALPDDPAALVRILEVMAAELPDYLQDSGLYRQLVVQVPGHTYHPTMTAGLVLDARRRLSRRPAGMSGADAQSVSDAERSIDDTVALNHDAYGAKLRQEAAAIAGSWRWYLDGCEHGDEDCADTYRQEVWLRTRLADLADEAARHELAMAEAAGAVAELDRRLRTMFVPGSYLGPADERAERDEATYWWLYGRPRG
jgi:hypothetical protein